jgi:phosphate transport system substrate-binding protein
MLSVRPASTCLLLASLALSLAPLAHAKGVSKGAPRPAAVPAAPRSGAEDAWVYQPGWENAFDIPGEPGIAGLKRLPRLGGSTTAGPLIQLIVARALGLEGEMRRLPVRRDPEDESAVVAFPFDTPREKLQDFGDLWARSRPQTTHGAYVSLIEQSSSLILVARAPSLDEIALARKAGVELDIRPVARDAFVFVVNAENKINGLSQDQVHGIYTGKITNWNEVGGEDKAIHARTRDRNSGSEELMKKHVLREFPIIAGPDRISRTMGGTLDAVAESPEAIAYSVFYYERVMNPRAQIKPIAINGVLPTSTSIADGTYPFVEPVLVVIRRDVAPQSASVALRDWLLSPAGQALVAQSGYAPLGGQEATGEATG